MQIITVEKFRYNSYTKIHKMITDLILKATDIYAQLHFIIKNMIYMSYLNNNIHLNNYSEFNTIKMCYHYHLYLIVIFRFYEIYE